MTEQVEQQVIEYLRTIRTEEPDADELRAVRASLSQRRRRRPLRRAVLLTVAIIAGSSALATATGVAPWWKSPDPIPPASVGNAGGAPADVRAIVGALRRPAEDRDQSREARLAVANIRSPYVVDLGSIRSVGQTPLGDSAFAVYVRTDLEQVPPRWRRSQPPGGTQGVYVAVHGRFGGIGADGPYPLSMIERGTAWGIHEAPSVGPEAERLHAEAPGHLAEGRYFTAVVPDGVAAVELGFGDDAVERHRVHDNVVIAHLEAQAAGDGLRGIKWLSADGTTLRTVRR
jgi:hypothetical protein